VTANGQTASRLDRIYVQRSLKGNLSQTNICPITFSDHSVVSINIDNADWIKRGPGFWKFNCSLLNDTEYHRHVQSFWDFKMRNKGDTEDLISWWEEVKLGFVHVSKQFSIKKARKMRKDVKALERLLFLLSRKVANGAAHLVDYLNEIKCKLRAIEEEKAKGAKIRSRAQMYVEGEKNTKYFCNLERFRGVEKLIRSLQVDHQVLSSNTDILSAVQNFYQSLYRSEPIDEKIAQDLLNNIQDKLPPSSVDICEQNLSFDEITKSLNTMKAGKSPGGDGLCVEFYQTFWHLIGKTFHEVVREIFHRDHLSETMSQAYVRLIYKKGDRSDLKNYRPISLLGVDYKIISRALSLKLGGVLADVINPDQTCSIPGRSLLTNAMMIRDVIQLVETDNIYGAIVGLDNEKAFDRLEWDFLFMSLNHLGFGPNFIKWVRILYRNISSRYIVNNYVGQPVSLERGVRQGCSLSPLLFVIAMESLGATLRQDIHFQGMCIQGIEKPVKVSQYCDDTTVFVGHDQDFDRLNVILQSFQRASGLKINKDKSVGLFLGPWKTRTDQPMDITWTSNSIKILGIHFSKKDFGSRNWTEVIAKLKKTITMWRHRHLTIFGRALVLNSLILSQIWYVSSVVHMPKHIEQEINRIVFDFLWEGNTHLVSQRICTNDKLQGGLAIPDIRNKSISLRLNFFNDLIHSDNQWAQISRCLIERYVEPFSAKSVFWSSKPPPNYTRIPSPYLEVKKALDGFVKMEDSPLYWEHALNQQLWGNDRILHNGGVLYYFSLARHGLKYFSDLVSATTREWKSLHEIVQTTKLRPIDAQRLLKRLQVAIPREWFRLPKASMTVETPTLMLKYGDRSFTCSVRCKYWYHMLKLQNPAMPKAIAAWENSTYFPENWNDVWCNIHSSHIPNRARDVVWRLIHRRLWVGSLLKKVGITESDRCLLCLTAEETLVHLFVDCTVIAQFWTYIKRVLIKFDASQFQIAPTEILFHDLSGYNVNNDVKKIALFCLSLGNWSIWKYRCSRAYNVLDDPSTIHFTKLKNIFDSLLAYCLRCEYHASLKGNSLHRFKVKWCRGEMVSIDSGLLVILKIV
jgi:hypothetical protein